VKLVQLRYVKSVASTGSFSMSARLCGVAQPTISNAISDLEAELRAKIFVRTSRRVELTPFGARVIGYVECILNHVEDIRQEAESYGWPAQRVLRVAFSPVIDGPRLMGAFESFRVRCPEAAFVYKECGAAELERCLGQERLDVICGVRIHDSPAFNRCALYADTLRFLPKGPIRDYRGPRTVSLADVSRETLIFAVDACGFAPLVREYFHQQNLDLKEYPGHPLSYRVIQEWSNEGIGAAVLPESKIEGDVRAYPLVTLNDQPLSIVIEAVWVRGNRAPHVKAFATFLRGMAASGALRGGSASPPDPGRAVAAFCPPPALAPSR
jgi:LysR family hydrogen peroxide-inducible transcriptional activator